MKSNTMFNDFRRVQICHDKGMSKEDIAQATAISLPLVQQYLDLIEQFGLPFPSCPPLRERMVNSIIIS